MGIRTKIYGVSDDRIEAEGDYQGEIGIYGTDDNEKGVLLIISDGTLLEIQYGKMGLGIWGIKVLRKGSLFLKLEICDNEDAEIYSDIAHFKGGIKSIYYSNEWGKMI